jgi:hypothetical protein
MDRVLLTALPQHPVEVSAVRGCVLDVNSTPKLRMTEPPHV